MTYLSFSVSFVSHVKARSMVQGKAKHFLSVRNEITVRTFKSPPYAHATRRAAEIFVPHVCLVVHTPRTCSCYSTMFVELVKLILVLFLLLVFALTHHF